MIESFRLNVPETQLNDLRDRLAHTRWPDNETVNDTAKARRLLRFGRSPNIGCMFMIGAAARRCLTALGNTEQTSTD